MANPFRSANLLYRAVESPEDDLLFQKIQTDPISYENSNAKLIRPQSRKDAAEYQKWVAEESLIGVIVCLPPLDAQSAPTAIGTVFLKGVQLHHHRHTEIGVELLAEYQGKGYGREAVEWILDWAFNVAGMHRVRIRAFEWNYGARRLYEKIGFVQEGIVREELWHRGRFWDGYEYGMLDREWEEIKAKKAKASS